MSASRFAPGSAPTRPRPAPMGPAAGEAATRGARTAGEQRLLDNWLAIQAVNLSRHARSLRPFAKDEFGTGPAAPSEAHVEAVNRFIDRLRVTLTESARWVDAAATTARREPSSHRLGVLLERKDEIGNRVLYVEGIWDFYYDLFVQRLSMFGERLRSADRIGANCYEDLYVGLGTAQPTPTLLPFSYADSGFSPATYRRGVPLRRLRFHPNLFPLITLPQHRLDNVWALSSVLHEVSHNLQADLGLWDVLPRLLYHRLVTDGRLPPSVARLWARWHKEIMADMFALVLGGPAAVESLMDVVARAGEHDALRQPGRPSHPVPSGPDQPGPAPAPGAHPHGRRPPADLAPAGTRRPPRAPSPRRSWRPSGPQPSWWWTPWSSSPTASSPARPSPRSSSSGRPNSRWSSRPAAAWPPARTQAVSRPASWSAPPASPSITGWPPPKRSPTTSTACWGGDDIVMSHENHLQEIKRRWNAVADAVAALGVRWRALADKYPERLDSAYSQRLVEVQEQHIPRTLQRLDEMPSTDTGVQATRSLTQSHLDQIVWLLAPPELAAELSVKERNEVRTLHMRALAAAQNAKQYVDQIQATGTSTGVIAQIFAQCKNPQDIPDAQGLIKHLRCAQDRLRDQTPDPTETTTTDAVDLANRWEMAVGRITGAQRVPDDDAAAVGAAADDIELHAQLALASQLLEAFVG